ncbi:MAG: FAD-dependent oxidoreductase [Pseudomonadales bacterium]|nr:FAD-dependent oxidoreductase [Pseudomonadales bacterium]
MARIAIVGSGISGLVCTYLLGSKHEVTLFEANDYLGGHTHTHNISVRGQNITVDTGFIVYNDRSYPNFTKLLDQLSCEGIPTEMSFSMRDDKGNLEYNGHTLNTLFAQRRNILRPSFLRLVRDIVRFNRIAKEVAENDLSTLDEYLDKHHFSSEFKSQYLIPMAAAIWSTGDSSVGEFPIRAFANFFNNHGLLDLKNRPQWYVVKGGSNAYIKAMEKKLGNYQLNTRVSSIQRFENHVGIVANGQIQKFDEVIIATHSNEALNMLAEPTKAESEILGAIRFTKNTACLHTDVNQLPKRPLARASWNYLKDDNRQDFATLTYYMNILQKIESDDHILVTLNDNQQIDPALIIKEFEYYHPLYNRDTLEAQRRHDEISGAQGTHYCGAYWHYGFHEDGVKSALRVCEKFGVTL